MQHRPEQKHLDLSELIELTVRTSRRFRPSLFSQSTTKHNRVWWVVTVHDGSDGGGVVRGRRPQARASDPTETEIEFVMQMEISIAAGGVSDCEVEKRERDLEYQGKSMQLFVISHGYQCLHFTRITVYSIFHTNISKKKPIVTKNCNYLICISEKIEFILII